MDVYLFETHHRETGALFDTWLTHQVHIAKINYCLEMACKRVRKFCVPQRRVAPLPKRTRWRPLVLERHWLVERVRTHINLRSTINEDGSEISSRQTITPETWWEDKHERWVVPRTPEIYDV